MTGKQDGGAAFPGKRVYRDSQSIDHEVSEAGMTLRDWFAGQALAGICAHNDTWGLGIEKLAAAAYEAADAMLAARGAA